MIKHIILWKLKETLTEEEKTAARAECIQVMKDTLEAEVQKL